MEGKGAGEYLNGIGGGGVRVKEKKKKKSLQRLSNGTTHSNKKKDIKQREAEEFADMTRCRPKHYNLPHAQSREDQRTSEKWGG